MNSSPLISVIVPVYNTEKYICECIDSILKQTWKNFECILINDGSTDSSPLILDAYATRDSRIRVIHKTNGGVISARKEGVKHAIGDYVYFIDSDDTISIDAIELIANEINDGTDIIIFGHSKDELINVEEYVTGLLTRRIRWSNWGNLYKKGLFDEHTFNTPRYFHVGEDFLTALRLAKNIKGKIITKDVCRYNYRICANSSMGCYKHALEYEEKIILEVNNIVLGLNLSVQQGLFNYNMMMLGGIIGLGLLNDFKKDWIKRIVSESKMVHTSFRQRVTIYATQYRFFQKLLIIERSLKEFTRKLLRRR